MNQCIDITTQGVTESNDVVRLQIHKRRAMQLPTLQTPTPFLHLFLCHRHAHI